MFHLPRLTLGFLLPLLMLGQTQIELDQSKYTAPGTGAVSRSGASKLADVVSVKDYGAAGDGATDDLPAINRALAAVAGKGQRIFFPAGTYMVSGTVVLPDKASIFGVGRGDPGSYNTVLKALPGFNGTTVVQMGTYSPSFDIQVEKLTIDGSAIVGTCLTNQYAEEMSYGRDLMLTNCGSVPLLISGTGAQNSGPFENLEIYPGGGPTVTTASMCVQVTGVISFRGIKGITCNGGPNYASRPAIGLALDGGGQYSDIHIEHFATAISLGNSSLAADGLVLANAQFGPDVTTGVAITNLPAANNQNIAVFGISCVGCTNTLSDAEVGTNVPDNSIGWYMIGNGSGAGKPRLTGNNGQSTQFFGQMMQSGKLSVGPSNPRTNATLSLYDASPAGVTTMVEVGGANQGSTNLFEWHNSNDTPVAYVNSQGQLYSTGFIASNNASATGSGGVGLAGNAPLFWSGTTNWFDAASVGLLPSANGVLNVTNGTSSGQGSMRMLSLQLASTGSQPACSSSSRGTMWFVQSASGTADHYQVCAKNASDAYSWVNVF